MQVVMVADEVDAISAEVRAASDAFEIVITAGGVGPTRDDVTMAGVAEALGKPISRYATSCKRSSRLYSWFWPKLHRLNMVRDCVTACCCWRVE